MPKEILLLQEPKSQASLAMLEGAGKALALASVCVLALSVAYDFGYLLALGLWFSSVPTNLADHARTGVIWIPGAILFAVLVAAVVKLLELASTRWRSLREQPVVSFFRGAMIVIGLVVVTAMVFRVAGTWSFLLGAPLVLWGMVPIVQLSIARHSPHARHAGRAVVHLIVVTIFWSAFLGYYLADQMVTFGNSNISVTLKVEAGQSTIRAKGIRRFSSVTIIVTEPDNVWVIPNDRIISTESRTLVRVGGLLRGGGGGPGEAP